MYLLTPDMARILEPACRPWWFRPATFVVVAGLVVLLLNRSISLGEALAALAVISGVTVAMTRGNGEIHTDRQLQTVSQFVLDHFRIGAGS